MKIYHSDTEKPYPNLQIEERLLHLNGDEASLLFWKSDSAVVIGKNQNPWNECNLPYCLEQNIKVARRITGGGTVYQDSGNLNYALCLPRSMYSLDGLLDQICVAFREAGLPVQRFQANGLGVDNRKFSGHAFCYRQDKVLHHGTCLLNADLYQLEKSIEPHSAVDTHAVSSCRAATVNLNEINPGVGEKDIQQVLINGCSTFLKDRDINQRQLTDFDEYSDALSVSDSEEWTYLKTPTFTLRLRSEVLRIRRGLIEVPEASALRKLNGCRFTQHDVHTCMEKTSSQDFLAELNPYWIRP